MYHLENLIICYLQIKMHTGEKIKIVRNLRNITQMELAEKINKTRALVSHIEQTGKVNHYTLVKILKVLKISEEDFENLEPKEILSQNITNKNTYELEQELSIVKDKLEHYQKANETLQDLVNAQKSIIASLKKR
jgi:transcriptional regulator with XRE-family HTH domain